MLDIYSWDTPNGQKVAICLEELAIPYRLIPVDIRAGDQHQPAFRKLFPNGKIPAMIDHSTDIDEEIRVFESGAILLYLTAKNDRLQPATTTEQAACLSWLFWQVSALGPVIGQWGRNAGGGGTPEGELYFRQETLRLMTLLDQRLQTTDFLAGPTYSIADIACFPWLRRQSIYMKRFAADDLATFEATDRWLERIASRPAVIRALEASATLAAGSRAAGIA